MVADSGATIWCWAMGLTQHRNAVATIKEVVNLALARGDLGQARGRAVPGARPLQRAGRPDHGHLGEAPDRVPRRDGRRVRVHVPPPARLRHRRGDPRHARGEGRGLRRPGRQLPARRAGHGRDGRGAAAYGADGAGLHQAQPVAPGDRRDRADPADPGPHRDRPAGQTGPQFVTVEDSMSVVHASRGRLAPASEHLRSEVAIVTGVAEAPSPSMGRTPRSTGPGCAPTTRGSGRTSNRWFRGSRTTRRGC